MSGFSSYGPIIWLHLGILSSRHKTNHFNIHPLKLTDVRSVLMDDVTTEKKGDDIDKINPSIYLSAFCAFTRSHTSMFVIL
jgi:hypothetical protein